MAGIYIHIPFCEKRCIYCDFYFVTTRKSHESFVQALLLEIEHRAKELGGEEAIETVYFGGGTPSLLSIQDVFRLQQALARSFDTSNVRETTFEINPNDMTPAYLDGLIHTGINRLSVGVQSFFQDDLGFMGRAHTAAESMTAIPVARQCGFENISADLIFGIPGQSFENWHQNLTTMAELEPEHISAYSLTVEPGTVLHNRVHRGLVNPAPEDALVELFGHTGDFLQQHGYDRYEISNYAKPGRESVHNKRYWEHENYIGLGPSAHSFWWKNPPSGNVFRWANYRNLRLYEDALLGDHRSPVEDKSRLTAEELANEYIMLRTRTRDGLDLDILSERYGFDLWIDKVEELAWLESEEYVYPIRNDKLRLTDEGLLLCDSITGKLLIGP